MPGRGIELLDRVDAAVREAPREIEPDPRGSLADGGEVAGSLPLRLYDGIIHRRAGESDFGRRVIDEALAPHRDMGGGQELLRPGPECGSLETPILPGAI